MGREVNPIWDEFSRPAILAREAEKLLSSGIRLIDVIKVLAILHDCSQMTVRRAIKGA